MCSSFGVPKVYPKVKVREESEPVAVEDDRSDLGLKAFGSLLQEDEHTDNSTTPALARIPESYVPNMPMPSTAIKKGNKSKEFAQHRSPPSLLMEKNNKSADEDDEDRPNIRASPVPRPRAVLSSPDNDGFVGSRNRLPRGTQTTLKTGGFDQKMLTKGQPGQPKSLKMGTPRVMAEAENNDHKAAKPTPSGRTRVLRETQNKSKSKHENIDAEHRAERRVKPAPSWK
ncbi:hypothetical protein H6P81_011873 [Aristolochia fimbriata]|uniref:Uncharacterized protein n=1 Tax=Aristolochia fimbriata TaxID=158543 RepID=A0AAV7EA65_ARIFI|nr:hypothetical protein H6P81_011873 [Aristolochia fimbriata]